MKQTPRIYEKDVDKTKLDSVTLEQDEDILTPRQALNNLRRHLMGVVEAIDKTLRHANRPKV